MSELSHKQNNHSHDIQTNLNFAFWTNFIFAIIEIFGGILANSSAILADAVHDFGDSLAILIGIHLEKKSLQKPNNNYTFGYKRLSVLSSLITGAILISGSLLVIKEGVIKLFQSQPVNAQVMFYLAILGILVNGFGVWRTMSKRNQNEKIVNLHLLEDLLGWLTILVGSVVIYYTNWFWLDGALSLAVAVFTIKHAVEIIKENFHIFLNSTNKDFVTIQTSLQKIDGVIDVHDIHVWTNSDQDDDNLSAHIQVKDYTKLDSIRRSIKKALDSFHIHHVTLEFEIDHSQLDCNSN